MAALRKLLMRPELGAITAAIGVFVFFSIVAGGRGFLTTQGTANYLEVGATHGILAVSVALLMIAGEFDLSIGSMIGAAGMIIAIPVTKFGWPPWLAILAAFAFSLAVGYLNGWLVVKTRLPSFIITLASLYLLLHHRSIKLHPCLRNGGIPDRRSAGNHIQRSAARPEDFHLVVDWPDSGPRLGAFPHPLRQLDFCFGRRCYGCTQRWRTGRQG